MPKTSNISYPSEYLPIPLWDGYGLKPISPILRTQFTSGRSRQRRLYKSTPTEASVTWMFSDGEAQLFELWFRETVNDGVAWFNMPLRTPLGMSDYVCRFTDIYDGPTPTGGKYWQFTATLELWERPVLPAESLEFPDYIVNADIIDIAANREWPKS
ncbi:hypothetical protein LLQ54_20155 [Rouxiella badensis]|uniref:hypothetical protein n=1 Tax=Rouxiella badensis TaxID=1646377 RepID=UPI001D142126|nr:hypothetical protein [Rouxiella badensis]MCC3720520.1 hypothetical protein [Rouxiella badensis]MCC3730359.1 hypothetical protein [Rouxiella badensis]MCC3742190.1 hypothetical protein [Rouxiella badensis]WAT06495.1 hypothetical protein O1V64_11145 [Rouxiella badensis]